MSEEYFIRLLMKRRSLKKSIEDLNTQLKNTEREMDHFDYMHWWNPLDMCCNSKECGDDCENGCDMPKLMWEDRKKGLMRDMSHD